MSSVKVMTNAEKAAVEELRKKFVDDLSPKLYENTLMFYRFLKARDFNLDNAECMLRKHIQWRKEQDIDNISTYKHPEVLEKYVPESRFGFDKDGCPSRYIPLGRADAKGLQLSAKFDDINKIAVRELESDLEILEDHYNRFGKILGGCTYVYDMRDLSFAKATDKSVIGHFAYFVTIYQDNYPEMMKAVYVINPPMFFYIPFAIIKACLTGTLISKITIFAKDDWKEELLKRFDADQLPAFLGGTMTDPDGNPMCYTIVKHGELVPESYYIHKSKKSLAQAEGVKRITLSRGSSSEVTVEVKEYGSLIEWEYETNSKDIKFGLLFQEMGVNGKKVIELVPTQKIDTNDYPQTGMYKCGKVGTYVILFDNSYSWMRSKRIYYRVKVVPPEDQEISVVD